MRIIEVIGIAIALSLDAFAISLANGFIIKKLQIKQALVIAFSFGFFQLMMPVLGWLIGITCKSAYTEQFDHWVAFVLLMGVSGKMIWESFQAKQSCSSKNCLHWPTLLLLSLATSIDALAVGLSFAFIEISIILPVLIIGLITFLICFIGTFVGNKLGQKINFKLELIGAGVLIMIAFKILLDHLK